MSVSFSPRSSSCSLRAGPAAAVEDWPRETRPIPPARGAAGAAVPVGLPVPVEDPADPQASFLRTVRAPDPARLLEKLVRIEPSTVETEFRKCRVYLERADLASAKNCLRRAEKMLGERVPYDWRTIWHRGLLALAQKKVNNAKVLVDEVYWNLPVEQAPKLAIGFCAEELGATEEAERYYSAAWTRHRAEASAAFGLSRSS